ncbi:hypothetical protein FKM82_024782 [Ascaphus truei]
MGGWGMSTCTVVSLTSLSYTWFERFSMLVILLNCVTLGMFHPCEDIACESQRCKILQGFDDFIFAFFAVEMIIKMFALGIFGKKCYLGDTWNRLDFFIVVAGMLEYSLDLQNVSFSAVRTVRVLRPLRAINRVPSMRILVTLLLDTLPMLGNVLLLCFFVFFIFGIVGVQLWAGLLRNRCFLPENFSLPVSLELERYYQTENEDENPFICSQARENGMRYCRSVPARREESLECTLDYYSYNNTSNTSCINWNQYYTNCSAGEHNPFKGAINFDNIGYAWIAIFQVITLEGWVDIMYFVMDAHSFYNFIYFILLIIIGSFFMINLCLVVIATQFSETKQRESQLMKEQRVRFLSDASTLASFSEPGSCYDELLKYLVHVTRKASKQLVQFYRAAVLKVGFTPSPAIKGGTEKKCRKHRRRRSSVHHLIHHHHHHHHHYHLGNGSLRAPQASPELSEAETSSPHNGRLMLTFAGAQTSPMASAANTESIHSIYHADCHLEPVHCVPAFAQPGTALPNPDALHRSVVGNKIYPTVHPSTSHEAQREKEQGEAEVNPVSTTDANIPPGPHYSTMNRLLETQSTVLSCTELEVLDNEATDSDSDAGSEFTQDNPGSDQSETRRPLCSGNAFKTFGYGPFGYIKNPYNIFDGIIVIISVWEIIGQQGGGLSVLRTFRLMRVLKLVRFMPALQRQLVVLMKTMDNVATFCMLLMLFIFIFSILGMHLFGCKFASEKDGDTYPDRKNFDSLLWATVTVFQILTQEDWNKVLYNGMASTSSWAALYFIALMTFGNYVLFNLLVAILVEGFQTEEVSKREDVSGQLSCIQLPVDSFVGDASHSGYASRPLSPSIQRTVKSRKVFQCMPVSQAGEPRRESNVLFAPHARSLKSLAHLPGEYRDCNGKPSPSSVFHQLHLEDSKVDYDSNNDDDVNMVSVFRTICNKIIAHKMFDHVVLVIIFLNCITIAMERPKIEPQSAERIFLTLSNYIFTCIFLAEMTVKVVALSLCFGGKAYLRSSWNILDGMLVLISVIDVLVSMVSDSGTKILGMLRVLRLLRTLRPLRVISRAQGLKLVVETLMSSLKPIGNIVVICCAFFIIFGILGVQLFKGKFFYCLGEDTRNITNKSDCLEAKYKWARHKYNFDNLGQALMSLFVLASKDGWVDIMYDGLDAVGVNQQPVMNHNPWMLLYFISFLLIVAFFVLNMFVGVVVENFHKCRQHQEEEEAKRREEKRLRRMEKKRRSKEKELAGRYSLHISPSAA